MSKQITVWGADGLGGQLKRLMEVWVDDSNSILTIDQSQFDKDPKVKCIRRIELYARHSRWGEQPEGRSLLLNTVSAKSCIKVKKRRGESSAHWQITRDGHGPLAFRPSLVLNAYVRTPLADVEVDLDGDGWELKEERHIEISLEYEEEKPTRGIKCETFGIKGLVEYDRPESPGSSLESAFDHLIVEGCSNGNGWKDQAGDKSDLHQPRVFLLGSLCAFDTERWSRADCCFTTPGSPPKGRHLYALFLRPLGSRDRVERHGLEVWYNCVPADKSRGGWGVGPKDAALLWPFALAPAGAYRGSGPDAPTLPRKVKDRQWDLRAVQGVPVDGETPWSLEVHLPYRHTGPDALPPTFPSPFKDVWNREVGARAGGRHDALNHVRAGAPASLLPTLGTPPQHTWGMCYDVVDCSPHDLRYKTREAISPEDLIFTFRHLTPASSDDPIQVDGLLDNFVDVDGHAIRRTFGVSETDRQGAVAFSISDRSAAGPVTQSLVGSLTLFFGGGDDGAVGDDPSGHAVLRFEEQQRAGYLPRGGAQFKTENNRLRLEAELPFRLSGLGPGGQDASPPEQREAPGVRPPSIVIPFQAGEKEGMGMVTEDVKPLYEGDFILIAREFDGAHSDHVLTMRLERLPGESAGPRDVDLIVIDPAPFLIARVRADIDIPSAREVGNWTGNALGGPSWELVDLGAGFYLFFPPQVLGEELIRAYDEYHNKPFRYRFSPPARFHLDRSPFRQGFKEIAWNLRRLKGYAGQRDPGMGVRALDFELNYGVATHVEPRRESVRIAETEATLGLPPARLDPEAWPVTIRWKNPTGDDLTAAYGKAVVDYASLLSSVESRLTVLQPRLLGAPAGPTRLTEGVRFRFRDSRKIAHPFTTPLSSPMGEPPGPTDPPDSDLRGGVDWGFTSERVYDEVRRSEGTGEVVDPWFSSLGGGGHEKAIFANGKSILYSDASLGRLFYYRLERIGRIAILWHRAKHVLVYERSVVHSNQFKDKNEEWLGWAVPRKMEEYVQILPRRRYPEFGGAGYTRGFVEGCTFPEEPIPVDSAWGRDLEDGWIVPLFNPRVSVPGGPPEVRLLLTAAPPKTNGQQTPRGAAAAAAEPEQTWGLIKNPENLVFFTSTAPGTTDDTDAWPAVPGVDFPLVELPIAPEKPGESATVEPGYDRFTLRVDAGSQPINLLAERVNARTQAVIENVVLARRSLVAAAGIDQVPRLIGEFSAIGRSFTARLRKGSTRLRSDIVGMKASDLADQLERFWDKEVKVDLDCVEKAFIQLDNKYKELDDGSAEVLDVLMATQRRLEVAWAKHYTKASRAVEEELASIIASTNRNSRERIVKIGVAIKELQATALQAAPAIDMRELEALAQRASTAVVTLGDRIEAWKADLNNLDVDAYRVAAVNVLRGLYLEVERLRAITRGAKPSWDEIFEELKALGTAIIVQVPTGPQIAEAIARLEALRKSATALGDAVEAEAKQIVTDLHEDRKDHLITRLKLLEDRLLDLERGAGLAKVCSELKGLEEHIRTEYLQKVDTARIAALYGGLIDAAASAEKRRAWLKDAALEVVRKFKLEEQKEGLQSAFGQFVEETAAALGEEFEPYERWLREAEWDRVASVAAGKAKEMGDNTLRLLRAYGRAPVGEAISIARKVGAEVEAVRDLAYYFVEKDGPDRFRALASEVGIPPSIAVVAEAGKQLQAVNVRQYSRHVAEKFLPDEKQLKEEALKSVIPCVCGIRLDELLQGQRFPVSQKEGIQVTHGVDPMSFRPWARCDVDVRLAGRTPLVDSDVVALHLVEARLKARTSVEVAGGKLRRHVEASLSADWELSVGGERVMTLRQATLHLDGAGRIRFDLAAKDVELAAVLRFITELLEGSGVGSGSGLTFEVVRENLLPVGARAVLNIALPPLQTGVFSMSNLALMIFFTVSIINGKFQISAGLGLASKQRPFNICILFLGGGGWLTTWVTYATGSGGGLTAHFSLGIAVGASFPFDIGVAKGGVDFFVSAGVEFASSGGQQGALTILLRVSISGEVSVLRIVSLRLRIALEARYESGGSLVCVGELEASIKICWCFTIEISRRVEFVLAGKGSGSGSLRLAGRTSGPPVDLEERINKAVLRHIHMFGN